MLNLPANYVVLQEAGNLSILFDVGGVVGGVIAGALSDASGASALVSSRWEGNNVKSSVLLILCCKGLHHSRPWGLHGLNNIIIAFVEVWLCSSFGGNCTCGTSSQFKNV